MARKIKKNIALENRRKELDEELRATQRELRRRIRQEKNLPDPVAVLRRLWPSSDEPVARSPSMPVGEAPVPAEELAPVEVDRSDEPPRAGGGGRGGERSEGPIRRGDARFASYFVAGGLHGIEPQHRDKSILLTRAMVLLLFILVVGWTAYVIFF